MRKFLRCFVETFTNYFVAYIPFWWIRKMLYRILGMKIGKGSRINQRVYVFKPWKISIGENTMINSFAILDGRGCLSIGNNCSISMRSIIYSASHKSFSDSFEYYEKATTIGNNAWICTNAIVLAGSVIADGVIVSANSVIKGNTESASIYMGVPAELVRTRDTVAQYKLDNKYYFL